VTERPDDSVIAAAAAHLGRPRPEPPERASLAADLIHRTVPGGSWVSLP
jgi:hypothetical protein